MGRELVSGLRAEEAKVRGDQNGQCGQRPRGEGQPGSLGCERWVGSAVVETQKSGDQSGEAPTSGDSGTSQREFRNVDFIPWALKVFVCFATFKHIDCDSF